MAPEGTSSTKSRATSPIAFLSMALITGAIGLSIIRYSVAVVRNGKLVVLPLKSMASTMRLPRRSAPTRQ